MIYKREIALSVLGHLSNDLNILRDRNYKITMADFQDVFHKDIFSVMQNVALEKDINEIDGFGVATYLAPYTLQKERFKTHDGVSFMERIKVLSSKSSFDYNYKMLKKFSILNRFENVGMDVKEIYAYNTLDPKLEEKQLKKLEKTSLEEIKQHFKNKLIEIDLEFQSRGDSYSFDVSDGLQELIISCKNQENWGASFQSKMLNAVFGGMVQNKFLIRSAGTGGSKTRQALGDIANTSCYKRYDPIDKEWRIKTEVEPSLFISTELMPNEVQLALLSTVSGVKEEKIKYGQTTSEEDERLSEAIKIIEESPIKCEYSSNFSITEIENLIEKNIIRDGVKYVFFDYMQVTSNLASELNGLFGYTLREDQMLNQLSTMLKNICNKFDIFLCSSTQLNRSYKIDTMPDATWLRGGMAVLDKCDFGVITVQAGAKELEKVKSIIDNVCGFNPPTHIHYIIKNRGGKWVGIALWVNMDLDTINVRDGINEGFATTMEYEYIKGLNPVTLE